MSPFITPTRGFNIVVQWRRLPHLTQQLPRALQYLQSQLALPPLCRSMGQQVKLQVKLQQFVQKVTIHRHGSTASRLEGSTLVVHLTVAILGMSSSLVKATLLCGLVLTARALHTQPSPAPGSAFLFVAQHAVGS